MHNDIPRHKPNDFSRAESGKPTDPALPLFPGPDSDFELWLQDPGTWKERRESAPIVLLVLSAVPALVTSRDPAGSPTRTPIQVETVWIIPAGVPFAAHWHGQAIIAGFRLPAADRVFSEPRVLRLIDLTRMDWELARLTADACRLGFDRPEATLRLGRSIISFLPEIEAHWAAAGLSYERFQATTDFIEEHLNQKLSRELLAKADGQSLHHFARMFKLRTGLTLRQYIARRRCFRARELIESGERLVDAAAAVGFFDQSEMCNKFNLVFGSPPSTYVPPTT